MKTMKWLKISAVLHALFAFFCLSSTLCFVIFRETDEWTWFAIGGILMYGWIVNPTGPITLIVGLKRFLSERRIPEYRKLIGKRWLWFGAGFVFDLLLYLAAIMAMVVLTGGV